jgi:1-acyl-sn-glycerol-3-phosphate acyltransferase
MPAPRARSQSDLHGHSFRKTAAMNSSIAATADDLETRDPDYIRDNLTWFWMLTSLWFRPEVRGLEKIPPSGPVLMVGNHSGGNVTPDTIVFTIAFVAYFGAERPFYQLAHSLVMALPGLRWLRKYGTIAASHENADRALAKGSALLVYPGGDYEVHRPSWESAKVDFGGRKGFLETAHRNDVPLVPVVSIGGQETALFLSRGEHLARWLRLDKLFRLKVLPISLALPWGLNLGDMLGPLPLPAKVTIQVLDPIDVRARFGDKPDWEAAYKEVVGLMQEALSRLQGERRLPILG